MTSPREARWFQPAAWCALLALFAATWISPRWPAEQALHSVLTVAGLIWLGWHARQRRLSDLAFALLVVFMAMHCVASRWLYSNVPYDAWARAWLGLSIDQAFGWRRNQFDRFVHLLYGLCLMPALMQVLRRRWPPLASWQTSTLALGLVMVSSLVYEWAEWLIALSLSAQDAESYNGQQGDVWDAHKDMLLATLGAAWWCLPVCRRWALPDSGTAGSGR